MRCANITFVGLVAMLCIVSVSWGNTILYVDDNAPLGGDGLSWETAYRYLQDGLVAAAAMVEQEEDEEDPGSGGRSGRRVWPTGLDIDPCSVEVRVAQGRYVPDCNEACPEGNGDRDASFDLLSGVILKGGYAGLTGAEPNIYDPQLYRSVLSGDLAGNDLLVPDPCDFVSQENEGTWHRPEQWCLLIESTRRENSRHVVTTSGESQAVTLAGVMITGGNAYKIPFIENDIVNIDEEDNGGGIWNQACSFTLRDCLLAHNSCYGHGGGLFSAEDCNVVLEDCRFAENFSNYDGGTVVFQGGQVDLTRCRFDRNSSRASGVVICSDTTQMQLQDCTFVGNKGYDRGESIIDFYRGTLHLSHSVFRENLGPGVSCSQTEAVFKDSLFQNNTGSYGGVLLFDNSDADVYQCIFDRNNANRGGAIYSSSSSLVVATSSFLANVAHNEGGGIYCRTCETNILNCTFYGNQALTQGGAISSSNSMNLVKNCILWGNQTSDGSVIRLDQFGRLQSSLDLSYSNIQFGQSGISQDSNCTLTWGEGNLDVDPCFVDPGYWDVNETPDDANDDYFVTGGYHLKSQAGHWDSLTRIWVVDDRTSPCIDAGDPNSPIGLESMPNGSRINMGVYGGTVEASKSHYDGLSRSDSFHGNCRVDCVELAYMACRWLE